VVGKRKLHMKDKAGTEITVGCFIAYGHALGRCAGLRIGRVEALNIKFKKDEWDNSTVTVLGVDDDWESNKIKLLEKRSTLYFPERMIVLSRIPNEYLELYKTNCVAIGGKHKWVKNTDRLYKKCCSVCKWNNSRY
jgi:hypothetical protein